MRQSAPRSHTVYFNGVGSLFEFLSWLLWVVEELRNRVELSQLTVMSVFRHTLYCSRP